MYGCRKAVTNDFLHREQFLHDVYSLLPSFLFIIGAPITVGLVGFYSCCTNYAVGMAVSFSHTIFAIKVHLEEKCMRGITS